MAIQVACACGARFQARDDWAGRRAKCKYCGSILTIPSAVSPEANPPAPDFEAPLPIARLVSSTFDELVSEESPVSTRPPASPLGAGGASTPVRIAVRSDVRIENELEVCTFIEKNLRRHIMLAGDGTYFQVDLEATVLEWDDLGYEKRVTLSIYGGVNGRNISERFNADYSIRTYDVGSYLASRLSRLWDRTISRIRGFRMSPRMRKCVEDTLDKACMRIDKLSGVRPPASTALWNALTAAKIVATVLVGSGTLAWLTWKAGGFGRETLLFLVWATAAGMMTFFASHAASLLAMPESFYLRDARGRRILNRWMAKSGNDLRMRIGVMIVVVFVAAIGFGYMSMAILNRGRGGGGQAPQAARPVENAAPPAQMESPDDVKVLQEQVRKEQEAFLQRNRQKGAGESGKATGPQASGGGEEESPPSMTVRSGFDIAPPPATSKPSPGQGEGPSAVPSPFDLPAPQGGFLVPSPTTAPARISPQRKPAGRAAGDPSMRRADAQEMIGGTGGAEMPTLVPRGVKPLIGVRYSEGSWAGEKALQTLDPLVENERSFGPFRTEFARTNYAIGGLVVDAGQFVHAVRLIFMRIGPDGKLDPNDTYLSGWLGQPTDSTPVELNGQGRKVTGFRMRRAAVVDAIGLALE